MIPAPTGQRANGPAGRGVSGLVPSWTWVPPRLLLFQFTFSRYVN
jgi:hypothetical protein